MPASTGATLGGYVVPDSFSIVEIALLSSFISRVYKLIWNTLCVFYREVLLSLCEAISASSCSTARRRQALLV